jgi:hypothetical protein
VEPTDARKDFSTCKFFGDVNAALPPDMWKASDFPGQIAYFRATPQRLFRHSPAKVDTAGGSAQRFRTSGPGKFAAHNNPVVRNVQSNKFVACII